MWKFCRSINVRWCPSHQRPVPETVQNAVSPKPINTHPSFEKKKSSDQDYNGRENFNKESERFWKSSQFRYLLHHSSFFETAGWLGTASILCLDVHLKHFNFIQNHDRAQSRCIFSKHALAMESASSTKEQDSLPHDNVTEKHQAAPIPTVKNDFNGAKILEKLCDKSTSYAAAVQNCLGIQSSSKNNEKRAFRFFQKAASLGSSQGLFNLGLCFELGKGTNVNLPRACFCYRKAAIQGHGKASLVLAKHYLNGSGNLPADPETFHLLLEQAASKGVVEAELYLGLECLEEERYSEAFAMFSSLTERDNLDGRYYLGLCHENGWGTEKDEKAAAELYSRNSNLGHDNSTLRLSQCYEKGIGGCIVDLDFALALCQTLNNQESEEVKKAICRITSLREKSDAAALLQVKSLNMDNKKSGIHSSSSVPELATDESLKFRTHISSFISSISSYLNLIQFGIPTKPKKPNDTDRPSFFIGENEHNLALSFSIVSSLPENGRIVSTKT